GGCAGLPRGHRADEVEPLTLTLSGRRGRHVRIVAPQPEEEGAVAGSRLTSTVALLPSSRTRTPCPVRSSPRIRIATGAASRRFRHHSFWSAQSMWIVTVAPSWLSP